MKSPTMPANGANLPRIGLGTSRLKDDVCIRSVTDALELGYRHIDTAHMYGNEVEVGRAIKASAVPRGEIFVTTKVLPDNIGSGNLQDSAKQSLDRLGLDHVDLLLIHWPNPRIPLAESIAALCDAKKRGFARNIGVANFTIDMVEVAVPLAASHGETLATNQCEYHPRLNQDRLLATCRKHGIVLVSYCPVGQGRSLEDATVQGIARKVGPSWPTRTECDDNFPICIEHDPQGWGAKPAGWCLVRGPSGEAVRIDPQYERKRG